MTTVVYRDGILAADTLVTQGGAVKVHGEYRKIRRIGDHLVGTSGGVADCERFVNWLMAGEDAEPPKGEYAAIVVSPNGRVREIEGGHPLPRPRNAKFFAIGSGAPFALAAMYAGADAVTAVKIAAKIDTATGLPVRSIKL
jgi:ATP-dependent protease HslVU (ClpYQ) peptidase subunit